LNALNVGRISLAACLDAQRRVITNAVAYANERVQFNTPIAQFGAIRSKLADITSCYAGERLHTGLQKILKIELLLVRLKVCPSEAELKGVEEYAECSILKVAVSEDVQNCSDEGIQILVEWDSLKTPMESA
jgi:alkylation response protein AidB-like acyl-CoA dehydrogenase